MIATEYFNRQLINLTIELVFSEKINFCKNDFMLLRGYQIYVIYFCDALVQTIGLQ